MYEANKDEMNMIQKAIYTIFKGPIDRRIKIENDKILARRKARMDAMLPNMNKESK